jgi:hypothetical protein
VAHRWMAIKVGAGALALALACLGCKAGPTGRPVRTGPVDTGPGSLEATRRTLEGSWTLASLEVVDAGGARRPVKATGQLTYDAFGNMSIRGVIEDAAAKNSLVLDYDGRIIIDTAKQEFYADNLASDRPVDPGKIAPIAADKIRRYELTPNSFAVTYVDASGKPTAVARWRR